jgi:drug/metabolite transporter (DMT)-like permease
MIGAVVCFTAMLAFVKVVRVELSALDTMVWRSVAAIPLSLWFARRTGIRIRNVRVMFLRTVIGLGSMVAFFQAIGQLSLTELSLITRIQPIEVALLAPLFLGGTEHSSRSVWVALAVALLGSALLIMPPGFVRAWSGPSEGLAALSFSTAGLWALFASISSAGAHLCVRSLAQTDETPAVVFWFQFGSTLIAGAVLIAATGGLPPLPSPHLWGPIVGIGITATLGQILMTRGYSRDQASVVAGATYSEPLVTLLADVAVFATWPPVQSFVGGALIIAAGLPILLKQNAPARAACR